MDVDRRQFLKYLGYTSCLGIFSTLNGCKDAATDDTPEDNIFKIGGIGPVTGINSVYGLSARFGAQVAIDELNAKGFNKYELNFQDNESRDSQSAKCYNILRDWGAQMLLGPITTASADVVAKKAACDNVFMLTPSASSSSILVNTEDDRGEKTRRKSVFQSCCSDVMLGAIAANSIYQYAPHARIGVAYNNMSEYSKGLAEAFLEQAKKNGLRVVVVDTYNFDTNKSFSKEIKDAKDYGVGLMFVPDYYPEVASVIKQADQLDYHPIFMAADGIDAILTLEGFDERLAEGVLGLSTFTPDEKSEKVELFVNKYKQLVDGDLPHQVAAEAYDAVYLLDAMILKSRLKRDSDPSEVSDALQKIICDNEFKFSGLTAKDVKWNDSGVCDKEARLMVVKNNSFIPINIED